MIMKKTVLEKRELEEGQQYMGVMEEALQGKEFEMC